MESCEIDTQWRDNWKYDKRENTFTWWCTEHVPSRGRVNQWRSMEYHPTYNLDRFVGISTFMENVDILALHYIDVASGTSYEAHPEEKGSGKRTAGYFL